MGVEGNIDYAGTRGEFQVYNVPMPNILILFNVGLVIAIITCKRSQTNSVTICVVFGLENRLFAKIKHY